MGLENAHAETPKEKLLRSFDKGEMLEMNGEQVRIVDIAPDKLKSQIPTLILPGFSATPDALKDVIIKTAEAGRRVVSSYAPHGIEPGDAEADLAHAELRKLALTLKMIEHKNIEKVNVIANSEASIYLLAAAKMYPEKFANIVLIEPAGLYGDDTVWNLLKRTYADMQENEAQKPTERPAEFPSPRSVGIKSILSNPAASLREMRAIVDADITESLKSVHDAGVRLSIIHAVDDKLFPMENVLERVHADMVDGFYSIKGTHHSIYQYEPYGEAAEAALTALERKGEKK